MRDIENLDPLVKRQTANAYNERAHAVMLVSQRECPVEFGNLRQSGKVHDPEIVGAEVVQELSYGTEYAIYVHEDLTARRNPPTKAKFLEDPIKAEAKGFEKKIGSIVERELKRALKRKSAVSDLIQVRYKL